MLRAAPCRVIWQVRARNFRRRRGSVLSAVVWILFFVRSILRCSRLQTRAEDSKAGAANLDVQVWLRTLGLESYEEAFRSNAIDSDVLFDLSEADLERLGVLLGHRKKMLNSIARLRADRSTQRAPGPGQA